MAVTAVIAATVVGAGVALYGMSQQRKAAKKAARAQREANKARTASAALENRARRAKLIRQQQLAQAQAEATQAGGGGAGVTTSMASGALATSSTQGAVNLSNFAEFGRQGSNLARANLAYGRAQSRMARGKSFVALGGTLMNNAQRIGGLSKMFSTGTQATQGTFRTVAEGVPHTTGMTSIMGST